jgi:putative ABC transport system permease protein
MQSLPVRYSVRSLLQRRLRSALTVLGVAVAVFVSVLMLGLSRGMLRSAVGAAVPANVVALSIGAESLEFSAIEPADFERFRGDQGIVRDAHGQPLASPEIYLSTFVSLPDSPEHDGEYRGIVRGVRPIAFAVHDRVHLLAGALPGRGGDVVVGRLAATKLGVPASALAIGRTLAFEGQTWRIVGHVTAPGSALESEIWADLDDVTVASRRRDYSVVTLKAADAAAASDLAFELGMRTDVRLATWTEPDFHAAAAARLRPVGLVSVAVTVMLMLAATMAGMNTLFSAILGRAREMAILIVRGYRRRAVLLAFLLESVALCLAGGVIGAVPALLLNDLPLRVPMGAFRFVVDGQTVASGLLLSVLIGLIGAAFPLAQAARRPLVEVLRSE